MKTGAKTETINNLRGVVTVPNTFLLGLLNKKTNQETQIRRT